MTRYPAKQTTSRSSCNTVKLETIYEKEPPTSPGTLAAANQPGRCNSIQRLLHDYNENLLTKPVYFIQDKEATSFTITVKEGTPSEGPERVTDVKEAASTVAKAECQKLGWEKWDLNYIEDHNRGWMHVVVAKVTRK